MTDSTAQGRPRNVKGNSNGKKKPAPKSFVAFDEGAEITYEFVAQDGRPVKLGDGTFGCVFHVRGRNRNCALKIFYDTKDDLIASSQTMEMNVGRELHSHYINQPMIAAAIEKFLVVPVSSGQVP